MINSLLVNEACLMERIQRNARAAESKLLRLSREPQSGYGDNSEWFAKIKSEAESGSFERRGSVAVIKICGGLDYQYDFWSWLFDCSCYIGITNAINAAMNDTGITKIVLYVDSPGGGFHGCQECSDAIFAARSVKEVVAVADPEAASAGYWLASQADRIVCLESGWVGSLGSQTSITSYYRMYQEIGIDRELIRAAISPDKNLGAMNEPISDKARAERQRWADYAGEIFVEHVMRGRGKTRQQVLDQYGQGTMFFASEAISRGMVDSIGNLQSELVQTSATKTMQSNRSATRSEAEQLRLSDLI